MSPRRPPRVAATLLDRLGPADDALIGDLLETFTANPSALWFWRQVAIAVAVRVLSDIRHHPFQTMRAVLAGWVALWVFYAALGDDINRFASGWLLDRLVLLRWDALAEGSDTFVMLFATRLYAWPVSIIGFVLSGWLVAMVNRRAAASGLAVFAATLLLVSMSASDIIRSGLISAEWRHLFALHLTIGRPSVFLVWRSC
ncbi:MAG TPA: hypothetical protein VEA16_06785 [Vicinamibacterales bacterium]|nr:hypothetical protein [Vicinamibacterales bacterium]